MATEGDFNSSSYRLIPMDGIICCDTPDNYLLSHADGGGRKFTLCFNCRSIGEIGVGVVDTSRMRPRTAPPPVVKRVDPEAGTVTITPLGYQSDLGAIGVAPLDPATLEAVAQAAIDAGCTALDVMKPEGPEEAKAVLRSLSPAAIVAKVRA